MTDRPIRSARAGRLALLVAAVASGCAPAPVPTASPPPATPPSQSLGQTVRPGESVVPGPIEGPAIAFHADPDGNDDFYLVGADGNRLRPLTRMAETVAFPYWSPDGTKIAYLCCVGSNASLWVMNADGSGMRRLTTGRTGSPSWSPDGGSLAYEDHDAGAILVMAADGSGARSLAGQSGGPSWSPDGTRIVFISWRDFPGQDQRNELYVMDADGTNQRRLTDNEAEDIEPSWSPDGARIAFTSGRDGNSEIYVAQADGSDQRRLTADPAPDEGPSWSPDGSRIVFTSYRDGADPLMLGQGNAEILTVVPDGSIPMNLTTDDDWDGYPAWSPDGSQIAFSINNGVEFDLFVMSADGTDKRRLPGVKGANGIANDCCPAWRP